MLALARARCGMSITLCRDNRSNITFPHTFSNVLRSSYQYTEANNLIGFPSARTAQVFAGSQAYPSQLPSHQSTSMAPPLPLSTYDQSIDPRSSFSSVVGGPISAHTSRGGHGHNHTASVSTIGSPMQTSPDGPPSANISHAHSHSHSHSADLSTPTAHGGGGAGSKRKRSSSDVDPTRDLELYGDVRDTKRPKFILVEDAARNQQRVRVRVTLNHVNMDDVPDSYRKKLSVYPRAYFPLQLQETLDQRHKRTGGRWVDAELGGTGEAHPAAMGAKRDDGDGSGDDIGRACHSKTSVRISNINGGEGGEDSAEDAMETDSVAAREHGRRGTIGSVSSVGAAHRDYDVVVPGLTAGKRKREEIINELGVRMAWSQSRVFSGRILFLQRSCESTSLFPVAPLPSCRLTSRL